MSQFKRKIIIPICLTSTCIAILFLSGCATIVTLTQDEIVGRSASADLKLYINKSERVLACVKKTGGTCQANVGAQASENTPARQAIDKNVSTPAFKAQVLNDALNNLNAALIDASLKQTILATFQAGVKKTGISTYSDDNLGQVKAATFAAAALTNPTHIKLEELYKNAAGITSPADVNPLELSKSEIGSYAKSIQEATNFQGWSAFRLYLQGMLDQGIQEQDESIAKSKTLVIQSAIEQLSVIEAYITAYFENGEFVSLDIDSKNIQASAIKELKNKFKVSDDVAKDISVEILTAIIGVSPEKDNKYHLLTKMKDGGFVTRGGTKYVFPGLSVNIDPLSKKVLQIAKIDFTQVGSDVVRVFLEAVGDQLGQLPADQTSTACKAIKSGQFNDYPSFTCYVESDKSPVKAEQFTKVNERANQAESLAATVTGEVLRGVSWLSLNNEALAKIIETAVGVVARKATEKVAWCIYSCKDAKAPSVSTFSKDSDIRTIPFVIK